jgi:bifunctional enzyme CysN/CysC
MSAARTLSSGSAALAVVSTEELHSKSSSRMKDSSLKNAVLPAEQRPLLRFSTAGSVDDGKSTLIGRLLHDSKSLYDDHIESIRKASEREGKKGALSFALLTDGLRAEREQGITIDVAYRYFSTPRRHFIMADSPGHEQYTRNMATGASTADVTVILVDARKGVLIQTRRHAFIASLLGVSSFLVAVNKMDLVDFSQEVFESIQRDFLEFASRLGISRITFIPVSALHGDNIVEPGTRMPWYKGDTLLDCLENAEVSSYEPNAELRFPIQLVLRDKADYRGYAGRIASGSVKVGEEVMVLPSMRTSRVTSIEIYDANGKEALRQEAFAPQSVVLTLADQVDVGRGNMLVRSGAAPEVRSNLDAMLVWMSEESLELGKPYLLKHATHDAKMYVESIHYRVDMRTLNRDPSQTLGLNDVGRVSITSPNKLFLDTYRQNRATGNFIVIDPATNRTVAAGMVVSRHDREFLPEISPRPELPRDKPLSIHLHREEGLIDRTFRERALGYPALTLWFTGLSGSGKSALAKALERRFFEEGRKCYRLDGDNLRFGLNRDLGFSQEDRIENIRRVAEVALLFNDAGVTTLCSFISPYARDRDHARKIVGGDRFVEIYVNASLEVCEARDPHGLYQKARRGEISEFTGISSPYEAPQNPELSIESGRLSVEECVEQIYSFIARRAARVEA